MRFTVHRAERNVVVRLVRAFLVLSLGACGTKSQAKPTHADASPSAVDASSGDGDWWEEDVSNGRDTLEFETSRYDLGTEAQNLMS